MGKCLKMFKEMLHILRGSILWAALKARLQLNHRKVVIVLVDENKTLDYYAMVHLSNFMDRKFADEAIILFDNKATGKMAGSVKAAANKKLYYLPEKLVELLYDYYSFYKFSDKVVFTYTERPRDNLLGRALKETGVNEEDAVCLGLYHLRRVPETGDR